MLLQAKKTKKSFLYLGNDLGIDLGDETAEHQFY